MSIARTGDILNRYLELELAKIGLNRIRFGAMNALVANNGSMTPSAISKWIFRTKYSVTSMIRVLQDMGYVKRKPKKNDHRFADIVVTEKGWKATDMLIPIAEEMSQQILSCLDEEHGAFPRQCLKLRNHYTTGS